MAELLAFSRSQGNDLVTPRPEFGFPGLEPCDLWCLCVDLWKEALQAGVAPPVVLLSTHEAPPRHVDLADPKRRALDLS